MKKTEKTEKILKNRKKQGISEKTEKNRKTEKKQATGQGGQYPGVLHVCRVGSII